MVGDNVRALRKKSDISQADLAARCSILGFVISDTSIGHIESGYRGVSDLEMALLAKALRVEIKELVPDVLPKWKKDVRSPLARDDD